ncbi:MAG: V-type ATP synthase subunit F, partial [Oscillospiraceae bacterium]
EALATEIDSEIERYKDLPIPAIIPIPGVTGNTGIGMKKVSEFVERAVGSDIVG